MVLTFCSAAPAGAAEQAAMIFVYHSDHAAPKTGEPASPRNQYTMNVLREALERTRAAYGDFTLTPSAVMHEKYRPSALEHGDEGINISVFPAKAGLGDRLIPVRVPIDRGLIGYRVLTILAADQPRFDAIQDAEGLKPFHFGLLGSWEDVEILQHDGVPVETSPSQEGLFRMLNAKRLDALNNAVPPVAQLFEQYHPAYPALAIEKGLLLHYPMPVYFWFRNTEDGRLRAERLRIGLESMVKDGALNALFQKYYGKMLKRLDFEHRRIVELPNPLLDGHDPLDDAALWYRPGETGTAH